MSLGFGIGSALFAIGAIMAMLSNGPANAAFAIGAMFFTSAAFVQWRDTSHTTHPPRRRSPPWWSAVLQLVGTLYFNLMTIRALWISIDASSYDAKVWVPDAVGSTLFLLSSALAFVVPGPDPNHIGDLRETSAVWANMFGSIMFAASAVAALALLPATLISPGIDNLGTLFGALGFLVAAALTWPEPQRVHPPQRVRAS